MEFLEATHRDLLQQKKPAPAQVCTQTEYFCGAGDVFLGNAHSALNKAGNCVFDKGSLWRDIPTILGYALIFSSLDQLPMPVLDPILFKICRIIPH